MRLLFRRHRRFILFAALSLALIFLLIIFQKTTPVVRAMNGVRSAFVSVGTGAGNIIEHIFYSRAQLLKENERLQSLLDAYALDRSLYETALKENAALKEQVGYVQSTPSTLVSARVVSRTAEATGGAILLDRGTLDGVHVGDAIVVGNGMFVGIITKASASSSIGQLLTHEQSKVGVEVLNADKTIGIAEGQDGVLLRISFIPQSVDLIINDLIVTSGLDAHIPSGLIVGAVKEVVRDEHDPFQQALIEPLIDVRRLTMVGILHLEDL